MKLFREGDHSKAICPSCEALRSTTYRRRELPFRHRAGTVSGVLAAVCDECETVVGIPQQSVPRISQALAQTRHSLEARLPRHLVDALNLTLHVLVGGPSKATGVLVRYYLTRAASAPAETDRLRKMASLKEAAGRGDDRLSMRLDDHYNTLLNELSETTGLTKSKIVRGIVMQAKEDILDNQSPSARAELRTFLQMAGA